MSDLANHLRELFVWCAREAMLVLSFLKRWIIDKLKNFGQHSLRLSLGLGFWGVREVDSDFHECVTPSLTSELKWRPTNWSKSGRSQLSPSTRHV